MNQKETNNLFLMTVKSPGKSVVNKPFVFYLLTVITNIAETYICILNDIMIDFFFRLNFILLMSKNLEIPKIFIVFVKSCETIVEENLDHFVNTCYLISS